MIPLALKISGAAAVVVGVLGIAFGSLWASPTLGFFTSSLGQSLVPFFPIFAIALGGFLLVRSSR